MIYEFRHNEIDKHRVGSMLSEDIKLPFKVPLIKWAVLRTGTVAIVGAQDNERLEDRWFLALRGGPQNRTICRDCSPAQDTETEGLCDLSESGLLGLDLRLVVRVKEYVTDGILPRLRKDAANVSFCFSLEETVRNTGHDTGTITIPTVSTSRTTVGHRTEELTSIGHDFVARGSLDMANKTDTAGVAVILVVVEALVGREGTGPGLRIALH